MDLLSAVEEKLSSLLLLVENRDDLVTPVKLNCVLLPILPAETYVYPWIYSGKKKHVV